MSHVTHLVDVVRQGAPLAAERLLPAVDRELRKRDGVDLLRPMPDDELLALNGALNGLALVEARAAAVVKRCFFVALTPERAVRELGVLLRTGERIWNFAQAWLFQAMPAKHRT